MKKSKIVLLCIAVVLIIVGAALAAAGLRMGAYEYRDQWSIHFPGDLEFEGESVVYEDWDEGLGSRGLVVEAGGTEVKIEQGARFAVSGNQEFSTREEDGKTIVEAGSSTGFGNHANDTLLITIPEGLMLENLEVDLGAGSMSVKDITVHNLEVDLGVGTFTMDGMILGNIELDCGMGSIYLNHWGFAEDYHREIDCAGGSVRIGKELYSGATSVDLNQGGKKEMNIDVALGSVIIQFEERIEETHGMETELAN